MSFEGDDQGYADDWQGEPLDEDIPSSGNDTWQEYEEPALEPDPLFEQGYQQGAAFALGSEDAQHELAQQREAEQAYESWQRGVDSYEAYQGRPISPGEWAAMMQDAQSPDPAQDPLSTLIHYDEELSGDHLTGHARSEARAIRMQNSFQALNEMNEPDWEEELPGPQDNYGLPEGASRQEIRQARDGWSLQAHRINNGDLIYGDD